MGSLSSTGIVSASGLTLTGQASVNTLSVTGHATIETLTVTGTTKVGSLGVTEGSNATMGIASLTAGEVTISTTKVTANSRIFLTFQSNTGTIGTLVVHARTANTSFVIRSADSAGAATATTATVAWIIIEPN